MQDKLFLGPHSALDLLCNHGASWLTGRDPQRRRLHGLPGREAVSLRTAGLEAGFCFSPGGVLCRRRASCSSGAKASLR